MSDTPRTADFYRQIPGVSDHNDCIRHAVALERENAALRGLLQRARCCANGTPLGLKREIDAALANSPTSDGVYWQERHAKALEGQQWLKDQTVRIRDAALAGADGGERDTEEIVRDLREGRDQLERALVSVIGLFDPYGRGRVNEPESQCADVLARARELLDTEGPARVRGPGGLTCYGESGCIRATACMDTGVCACQPGGTTPR